MSKPPSHSHAAANTSSVPLQPLSRSKIAETVLKKKKGSQLKEADDLLIPSYSYVNETLYDVDCIKRILGYFLDGIEHRSASKIDGGDIVSRSPALKLE
nr:BTB/POZ domain-containing protein At5g66560 isoform X3 [Arachis hypogaea]